MKKHFLIFFRTKALLLIILITCLHSYSEHSIIQPYTQTVRGKITDEHTKQPLPGATILVTGSNPQMGTTTDSEGNFRLEAVPVGRKSFEISYIGFEPETISGILVTTGREVILDISLEPSANELAEVRIEAHRRKDMPLNRMASVSARSFTVEETRRYAGGVDDPARMATVFAGVSRGGDVQDNALTIRGNSPKNIAWRLEGIDIFNPNHLGGGNVAGGGAFSILSAQLLTNSDFFTGAFPAEYGNAIGGVFDIRMRNGNSEKREHTIQAGILGIDISSEGPFKKGKEATYLFNYRYSTFNILVNTGLIPSDQIPQFQDISFKLSFPTKKSGVFNLWGIGGLGSNNQPNVTDPNKWITDWDRVFYDWHHNPGAIGLNHRILLGEQTALNTTIAGTGLYDKWIFTRLDDELKERNHFDQRIIDSKITLSSQINHRFNPQMELRSGMNYHALFFNLNINSVSFMEDIFFNAVDPDSYVNLVDQKGNSGLIEVYTQFKYNISSVFSINPGIHTNYFLLNDNYSVEPRINFQWHLSHNHKLSAGYGLHSQLEELALYFSKTIADGKEIMPNKDLDFTKAHHFVLSHDWLLTPNMRIKTEPYYQYIFNAPGIPDASYSIINYRRDFGFSQSFENNTLGINYGIDVTLERFFYDNYYFLLTGAVFESKYRGDDDVWRPTRYNKGHVFNFLFGREFFFNDNSRVLGTNIRVTYAGGERDFPVLREESLAERRVVLDHSRVFEYQYPAELFSDVSITYRINRERYSNVWALQILNVTANQSQRGYHYDLQKEDIKESKWGFPIPFISYKIEF